MKFKLPKKTSPVWSMLVMCLGVYVANTRCCWLLHQPEMPEDLKKFKRF